MLYKIAKPAPVKNIVAGTVMLRSVIYSVVSLVDGRLKKSLYALYTSFKKAWKPELI